MTALLTATVRPIAGTDWTAVGSLEERAYAPLGLSEGTANLRGRAEASPGTCFVLDLGGVVAGYVVALPYPRFRFPHLHASQALADTPPAGGNLLLHDLTVADEFRGRGWGTQLAGHLTVVARSSRFTSMSLVAVGGSHHWWRTLGFQACHGIAAPDGYGPGALVMTRSLS